MLIVFLRSEDLFIIMLKIYPKTSVKKNCHNSLNGDKESILKFGRSVSNSAGNSFKRNGYKYDLFLLQYKSS